MLVAVGLVLAGPPYVRSRRAALVPGTASTQPATASKEVGENDSRIARFDTFQLVIPDGWERLTEREGGEKGPLLYLRGPLAGGQHLIIAADVYPVAKGVTLNGFIRTYTAEWPIQSFPVDEEVKFCDQQARMLGFTNADGDNLVLFSLHVQQAFVIVMIAPAETMPAHVENFHTVLDGLQLYE